MPYLFLFYIVISLLPFVLLKFITKILNNNLGFLAIFILLYFPFIFVTSGLNDIKLFESVGYFGWERLDIYYYDADHRLYPYFPLTSLVTAVFYGVSQISGIPFLTLWRIATTSSLIVIAILIKNVFTPRRTDSNSKVILFLFSPISLWPVLVHAHHDVVLLLFYLLSLWLIFNKKEVLWGSFSFGLSVLFKTWSLIFLPLILLQNGNLKRILSIIILIDFVIMSISAFYIRFWHSSWERLVEAVTGYGGSWTVLWGPLGFLTHGSNQVFSPAVRLLYSSFLFLCTYLLLFKIKKDIVRKSEFLMLTFFVFTISWAPQYIFWAWPFIVISESLTVVKTFSLLSLPYILTTYSMLFWNLNFTLLSVVSSIPLWLFSLWLFLKILLKR